MSGGAITQQKGTPSLAQLKREGKVRVWALPRLRQMILDCYIEKVSRAGSRVVLSFSLSHD